MNKTITISQETYEKIKEQLSEDEIKSLSDFIGKKMFFRTVTYHLIGKVKSIIGDMFELEQASWVADSGRFMQAISTGSLKEVEPILVPWWVNIKTVTDMGIWNHELPTKQK